jgi:hypothetical protein
VSRGQVVHSLLFGVLDYFLDPSVEEVIWGRLSEPQAA